MAISTAEPVMKPLMTGWLRKYARNPSRNAPKASSITPDSSDSCIASATYSAEPASGQRLQALAVMSEATATGPTASVMLEPSSGVGDERQDAGVQPHLGRQPGQQRIGQALRDQHHRDDEPGGQVTGEPGRPVVAQPVRKPFHCRAFRFAGVFASGGYWPVARLYSWAERAPERQNASTGPGAVASASRMAWACVSVVMAPLTTGK
jgi:hypothetical protein